MFTSSLINYKQSRAPEHDRCLTGFHLGFFVGGGGKNGRMPLIDHTHFVGHVIYTALGLMAAKNDVHTLEFEENLLS